MAESLASLAAEFEAMAATSHTRARSLSNSFAAKLQDAVRQFASGRPGPNVITGAYRDSIYAEVITTPITAEINVGSDAPQAMRLEFGFAGTDALGRVFSQPPYPHYRPASDLMEPLYEEAMADLADMDLLGGGL